MLPAQQLPPPLLGGTTLNRRSHEASEARVDMTAMVDLVFMLNIFFLVTTLVTALAEVDLPAAKHVVGADLESSVVFTMHSDGMDGSFVYAGDGTEGEPLADDGQVERIAAEVEQGIQGGKSSVVIKAERNVPMRDVARVSAAANLNEDIEFFVAVMEKE